MTYELQCCVAGPPPTPALGVFVPASDIFDICVENIVIDFTIIFSFATLSSFSQHCHRWMDVAID